MIAVEFRLTATISGGWRAMPQVPAKGETVTLPGFHPTSVNHVSWGWGTVPSTEESIRDAKLNGSNRLYARVWLDNPRHIPEAGA